jgi:ligand-binding sensor domain-containing protein/two-component sensor histidine kinase
MNKKLLYIAVVFLKCNLLFAQDEQFNIKFFGVGIGLTSGNIRKIAQDNYGFMWIGTQDGLFRYDSRNFIAYNAQSGNNHRLCGQDVRWLYLDTAKSLIWVSTSYGGINAIDILTGDVVKYIYQSDFLQLQNNLIKSFTIFNDDLILGCERGLFNLQLSKNMLTPIIDIQNKPFNYYVDIITKIDTDKFIILCRNQKPVIYDAGQKKIVTHEYWAAISPAQDTATRFFDCSVSNNDIICITSTQSIELYRFTHGKLVTYPVDFISRELKTKKLVIRRCVADKKGEFWLATSEGLFTVSANKLRKIQPNGKNDLENNWLNAIYVIYIDKHNDVWLGCQDGLAYVKNTAPAFISTSYSISTGTKINHAYYLFPLNDSIIYSAAEEGLYKINRRKNEVIQVAKNLSYDYIFTDPFKRLVVSNLKGLFILEDNKLVQVSKVYPEFKAYRSLRINSAIHINDSCLAFGTENDRGILIWNYKARSVYQYDTHSPTLRLAENTVNNVFLKNHNEFFILSDASFSLFNYDKKTVKKIELYDKKPGNPLNIFFDMCRVRDTFYLACYGHGIIKISGYNKIAGIINTSCGLSNNGVYKILPWRDSLLFISTNNGLNLYNISTGKIKQFYKENGLTDNAFEETSGNSYKTEIFVGGTNGFTTVLPGRIKPDTVSPLLYIDAVSMERPGNFIKDTFNLFQNTIVVPDDALQVTVSFSAISYNNPEHVKFSYRIKELQTNWVNIGNQNFINLIGFPPGKYTLQCTVANEDGYMGQLRELSLIILPKWYQTIWFKITLLIILILLFYAFYRYRVSQLKKQEQIRTGIASDLHDDIGGTLNSVKIYIHMLETSANKQKTIDLLKESLKQATAGLRDMIWVLDDKRDSVEELVTRLQQFAIPVAEASGIQVSFFTDNLNKFELGKAEKRNLLLIIKESVTNSIKYSGCTKIEILLTKTDGKLTLVSTDNGMGFDEKEVKPGDGLKNMRQRAKQIHFNIEVDSAKGRGTKITVTKK